MLQNTTFFIYLLLLHQPISVFSKVADALQSCLRFLVCVSYDTRAWVCVCKWESKKIWVTVLQKKTKGILLSVALVFSFLLVVFFIFSRSFPFRFKLFHLASDAIESNVKNFGFTRFVRRLSILPVFSRIFLAPSRYFSKEKLGQHFLGFALLQCGPKRLSVVFIELPRSGWRGEAAEKTAINIKLSV